MEVGRLKPRAAAAAASKYGEIYFYSTSYEMTPVGSMGSTYSILHTTQYFVIHRATRKDIEAAAVD